MEQNHDHKLQGWSKDQISRWFSAQSRNKVRDYQDIVSRLKKLPSNINIVEEYGRLSVDPDRYPLLCVSRNEAGAANPTVIITGGVHGYEPSGIEAPLRFLETEAGKYSDIFNFVVFPCISPWAYEHDHRWNNNAEDPNRKFVKPAENAEESRFFMDKVESLGQRFEAAIDLHETPDRDIELRQQRADRFGSELAADYQHIPQGYYLMLTGGQGDLENDAKQLGYGQAIIDEIRQISPIAPEPQVLGHINRGGKLLAPPGNGVMRSYLSQWADLVAVTEVYPDHPSMGPEKSVDAQLAAIHGALKHITPSS